MTTIRICVAMLAFTAASLSAGALHAGPPLYLIVPPDAAAPRTAGYAVPVAKQGYAWGYFGAQPRPQVYSQRGYYGNYHWRTTIEPFRQ